MNPLVFPPLIQTMKKHKVELRTGRRTEADGTVIPAAEPGFRRGKDFNSAKRHGGPYFSLLDHVGVYIQATESEMFH